MSLTLLVVCDSNSDDFDAYEAAINAVDAMHDQDSIELTSLPQAIARDDIPTVKSLGASSIGHSNLSIKQ